MANTAVPLTSLDFDDLRASLKQTLKDNPRFRDYNFDGSNMGVLLDVLSHNSFLNSFYLNMVASEMFLDSAQMQDSIVSHAKELNYTPQSARSSEAFVDMTIETTGVTGALEIPAGTRFSGINSNGTWTFVTAETTSWTSPTTTYSVANLAIYEGYSITDSFVVDTSNTFQQFVMSNPELDASSIRVTVIEDSGASVHEYDRALSLYDVTAISRVYFVQAAQNSKYEITFGDGIFGLQPQDSAVVRVDYRRASGPAADGCTKFSCVSDLGAVNGGLAKVVDVTAIAASSSGSLPETADEIRYRAPRYFAAQERAVSRDDYESLILAQFGGDVADVAAYGGELLTPPLYGRVAVSLKPRTGSVSPDYLKDLVVTYLRDRIVVPGRVIVVDPDYTYLKVVSNISYDPTKTSLSVLSLKNAATVAIDAFDAVNLEHFFSDFRYSKFVATIDAVDRSFVSNSTDVRLIKRVAPVEGVPTSYTLHFGNAGWLPWNSFDPTVRTSTFSYTVSSATAVTVYPDAWIQDDGKGVLNIWAVINKVPTIVYSGIGSVDYSGGTIVLSNLEISEYGAYVAVYLRPAARDVVVTTNQVLSIDESGYGRGVGPDVTVSVAAAVT